ncbi:AAA family ATPase [Pseudomonas asiatica]|uniref:AAA family ATPase n=1 Tax=Pseudomonas asiatica TaxID=2219225 RepID=A0A9X4HXB5_9PSED|nr:AAA family ATPase [Pseudomonas asiatica]MDD2109463.1 AAA family ATPase [Pseudomonas asiatica]
MISSLQLNNFKCFKSAEFRLSPLTVFCGANSAGKSTAIQTLLLLKQSHKNGSLSRQKLSLVGEYFSFGHVTDVVSHYAETEEIKIVLDTHEFVSNLHHDRSDDYSLELESPNSSDHDFFTADFHYLSAYRLCPQNSYDVNCDTSKIDVGIYGQFAIGELLRLRQQPAPNQRLAKKICPHLSESADGKQVKLEIAFREAMKKITPGFEINLNDHKNLDKVSNTFPTGGKTINEVRPVNTGFGISYVLPIVVAMLCTPEGGYLVIENPEVHLHPAAQSMLAELLTMASTCGIQVIIETHSDHIVNGIRAHVKENGIANDFVTVNSVRADKHERIVTKIFVHNDGGLSDMDVGFFDQAEKDLIRLF